MLASLAIPLLLAAASPACALWPAPRSMTTGSKALWLEKDVEITYNGGPLSLGDYKIKRAQLTSERVVTNGVTRALDSIFKRNIVPWKLRPRGELAKHEPDVETAKQYVNSLRINVNGTDGPEAFKPLAGEVDESYRLTLSENGTATLTAVSSIGVLRGLETFVQLFYTHSSKRGVYTPYAPVVIADSPKYPHRGVLLDVARNWYPVDTIMRTIDAIAANKMNRLHLHVTDSQSWPLVIPSMPTLAEKGAYAEGLWYDAEDMDAIQTHGAMLGVEVIVEIDMPGHIGSLYHSHPELVVAYNAKPYDKWCAEPPCGAFRFNSSSVDRFLAALFDDLLPRLKPFSAYFHTGGDELNVNDSLLDDDIKSNSTAVLKPKIQAFIDRNHQRVREHGMTPMVWEEIPLQWNVSMGKDVVVQSWLGGSSMQRLTSMGYKVIESSSDFWYLDCGRGQWINWDNGPAFSAGYPFNDWCDPAKSWRLIYSHDPAEGLSAQQAKLVLGGEVAVWSETIDDTNLDALVWPRASAAAEVLWSGRTDPATGQNRSQFDAAPRLAEWRERMLARGIGAAPITTIWCSQAGDASECSVQVS